MQRDTLKSPWFPQLSQDSAQEALKVLCSLQHQPLAFLAHGSFPPLRTELYHGQGVIRLPSRCPDSPTRLGFGFIQPSFSHHIFHWLGPVRLMPPFHHKDIIPGKYVHSTLVLQTATGITSSWQDPSTYHGQCTSCMACSSCSGVLQFVRTLLYF